MVQIMMSSIKNVSVRDDPLSQWSLYLGFLDSEICEDNNTEHQTLFKMDFAKV